MKSDVNSLRAIVNDSRKNVEEKLENSVTRTAVVEDRFSSAENRISALEDQVKIFSDRLRKVEEKGLISAEQLEALISMQKR